TLRVVIVELPITRITREPNGGPSRTEGWLTRYRPWSGTAHRGAGLLSSKPEIHTAVGNAVPGVPRAGIDPASRHTERHGGRSLRDTPPSPADYELTPRVRRDVGDQAAA